MTGDDDDALRGIDLDAWEPPPPPPAGALADAVVAQLRAPAPSAAREPAGRRPRRWPIAVAVAAVALAAAGVLVIARWGTAREPAAGRGEVFAARASHLELGPSSAELDPGAEVRWQRDRRRIAAAQPRGAVLWRASADDTLVIDAGAAVASVEASGASLRVEVQMKSDMHVVGASAVAAAVVALVTVTVYEGAVKVTGGGQVVAAEPGSVVEVRPQPIAADAIAVGAAAPSLEQMQQEVSTLKDRLATAERALAVQQAQTPPQPAQTPPRPGRTPPQPARTPADSDFLPVRPSPPRAPVSGCDVDALDEQARERYAAGQLAAALSAFEQAYACRPDPTFAEKAFIAACNLTNPTAAARNWQRMAPSLRQRAIGICVRNGITEDMLDQAPGTTGTLRVTAPASATVFLDGNEVGTVPVVLDLAPGRHVVKLKTDANTYSHAIRIKSGETVTLDRDR